MLSGGANDEAGVAFAGYVLTGLGGIATHVRTIALGIRLGVDDLLD